MQTVMDFSHPLIVRARKLGRDMGVLRLFQGLCFLLRNNIRYEKSFERVVLNRIHGGDIVWDVGANIGHYTRKFSDLVGPSGHVVAFEPSPSAFAKLSAALSDSHNVTVVNLALADFVRRSNFYVRADGYNANDSLSVANDDAASYSSVEVAVKTGDCYVTENPTLAPSAIKIDVEGFESEVILGLAECLRSDKLKRLFVEIHFGILAARGLCNEPSRITRMLRNHGFVISWTDPSHICAER